MDPVVFLVSFVSGGLAGLIGGIAVVVSRVLENRHESDIDRKRRAGDREIDAGRVQALTLMSLQKALRNLRIANGRLHAAMRGFTDEPVPGSEIDRNLRPLADACGDLRVAGELYASRVLDDDIRKSAGKAFVLSSFVGLTFDDRGRADILGTYFTASNEAEELLAPELRKLLAKGYLDPSQAGSLDL